MAARAAAIAFCLAALASAGRARAEDDPSCAQYQEPMAYNDCLARHGPKAGLGAHPGRSVVVEIDRAHPTSLLSERRRTGPA